MAIQDALGAALAAITNGGSGGHALAYNPATRQLSYTSGVTYNGTAPQIQALYSAFNALSLLADGVLPAVPPASVTGVRVVLTGPLDLYCSYGGGSDSTGNGSQASPFKTADHAYAYLMRGVDLAGYPVTIYLTDNVPTPVSLSGGPLVGQRQAMDLKVRSLNPSSPVSIIPPANTWAFTVGGMARAQLLDVGLNPSGPGGIGISVAGGECWAGNIYFSPSGALACINTSGNVSSFFQYGGKLLFNHLSSAVSALRAENGSLLITGGTLECSGAPAFSAAFAGADLGGMIDATGAAVIPGACSGPRFGATQLGTVFTGPTGNPNFFPGSAPGYCDATSHYS